MVSYTALVQAIHNMLEDVPQSVVASHPKLQSHFDYLRKVEDTAPTLPIGGLVMEDVLKMFNLTEAQRVGAWTLQHHDIHAPSDLMIDMLSEMNSVVRGSGKNEAYCRCILNIMIVCCVADEKRLARPIVETGSSTAASVGPMSRSTTPTIEPAELSLRFETPLKYPVTHNEKPRTLCGLADYTLWYNDNESMGTNLVVVEAKKIGCAGAAVPQLVAYMAIVHATRRQEGKQNSVVYGICSDGNEFRFWRIDNNSEVSRSMILEWDDTFHNHQKHITSYIRYIVRAAVESSPTTTPVKGPHHREVRLGFFSNKNKKELFDYGIGISEIEDDDFEDVYVADDKIGVAA